MLQRIGLWAFALALAVPAVSIRAAEPDVPVLPDPALLPMWEKGLDLEHQKDPEAHSPYTAALALLALLELREAGLPWDGDAARRDAMLSATCAWFARTFVPTGPTPGWRRTQDPIDVVSPGLTFQVHSLLLRAEAEYSFCARPADSIGRMSSDDRSSCLM